jgi:hypothetical protein
MNPSTDLEIRQEITARPHPGGGYFWPPEECLVIGRTIHYSDPPAHNDSWREDESYELELLWATLFAQLGPGEYLFGLFSRRLFQRDEVQAVQISDVYRMAEFELQVQVGTIQRVGYVALLASAASEGLARGADFG